ncbi:MAG TPA: type II toxin-antitoxin system RelE/ParE family toxin [Chloroflexota bacterium]|nr:type II toxin-antitoxin system RelE/ParE family toxin [Chloroflexota bacterium]
MSGKVVRLRALARRGREAAVAFYRREARMDVALHFIDAVQAAHPTARSPRHAHELALPGLRAFGPRRFLFLVFDVVDSGHIDVWRVSHAARDITAWLGEPER